MENLKENASTTFAEEKKEYIYTCKIILYAMTMTDITGVFNSFSET